MNAEKLIKEGFRFLYRDNAKAMKFFEEALALPACGPRALLGKAEALYSLSRFDEAVPFYRQFLETDSDEVAWNNLGLCLLKKGLVDEAETCFQKAEEINPDYAESMLNMGLVWNKRHDHTKALACTRASLRRKPWGEGYYNLACFYALIGNAHEALRALDKAAFTYDEKWREAAKTDEDFSLIRAFTGFEAVVSGKRYDPPHIPLQDEPQFFCTESGVLPLASLSPADASMMEKGIGLLKKKPASALDYFTSEYTPHESGLGVLGTALAQELLGQHRDAEKSYRAFMKSRTGSDGAFLRFTLLRLSRCCFKDGRTAMSMRYADTVLESDPQNSDALEIKVRIFKKKGKLIEALAMLKNDFSEDSPGMVFYLLASLYSLQHNEYKTKYLLQCALAIDDAEYRTMFRTDPDFEFFRTTAHAEKLAVQDEMSAGRFLRTIVSHILEPCTDEPVYARKDFMTHYAKDLVLAEDFSTSYVYAGRGIKPEKHPSFDKIYNSCCWNCGNTDIKVIYFGMAMPASSAHSWYELYCPKCRKYTHHQNDDD